MNEKEIVQLVEEETGALFFACFLMPAAEHHLKDASLVDRFWMDYFCKAVREDQYSQISEKNIKAILEDLHQIADQANRLAMRLSKDIGQEVVFVPNTSEIAQLEEVGIIPAP
jgi:hypothetical protein